ncbi:MAG: bifunctional DNA-formamidopyrimidine glycosylase/DNA-(apurinic or apyrimidinic site) lyase [Gluconacetobacter diazotrophicus]|nr:bifunctional DNA-formamidopyrimidine glycosylase/DNA-(apurinic or apyrimidinic site) lyase [Gluconacetobacter diazotrophicus]
MPELPEVETTMRGMRAHLQGHRIVQAEVRRADLRWAVPPTLADRLRGARVEGFRRRAKYILMRLDGGDSVLIHLGMSGRVRLDRMDPALPVGVLPHEHLVMETEEGCRFGLVDPRRFGSVDLVPTAREAEHRLLAGLGPEPLAAEPAGTEPAETVLTAAALARALLNRRTSVKAVLLDQRVVAGLGNIYVCEALFRARIHPAREAGAVRPDEVPVLLHAVRAVLQEAIAAGGSSIRDYVQPSGELGFFQQRWRVYGKEGERCPECPGTPTCSGVRRMVQAGRSSFFCPALQA